MWILLDLIVLGIIALFVFLSSRKGFVRMLIELSGFVLAIILANILSTPLANFTYDKAIEPAIISSVQENNQNAADTAMDSMPSFVKNIIGEGGAISNFEEMVSDNMEKGSEAAVRIASQNVIKPKVARYISMFYIMVLTAVFTFLVGFVAKFVNKLFSFSVIGKMNSILGGVLGIGKGAFIAMIFCTIISLLVSFSNGSFLIFTDAAINDSLLFDLLSISI